VFGVDGRYLGPSPNDAHRLIGRAGVSVNPVLLSPDQVPSRLVLPGPQSNSQDTLKNSVPRMVGSRLNEI